MVRTSEDFFKGITKHEDYLKIAKAFAMMHVTEALREASEKVKMKLRKDYQELHMNDDWTEVDKDSILDSYPLENII